MEFACLHLLAIVRLQDDCDRQGQRTVVQCHPDRAAIPLEAVSQTRWYHRIVPQL